MAKLNIAKLNALCSKNIFVLLLIIGVLLVVILALLIDTRVKEKFTNDQNGGNIMGESIGTSVGIVSGVAAVLIIIGVVLIRKTKNTKYILEGIN